MTKRLSGAVARLGMSSLTSLPNERQMKMKRTKDWLIDHLFGKHACSVSEQTLLNDIRKVHQDQHDQDFFREGFTHEHKEGMP